VYELAAVNNVLARALGYNDDAELLRAAFGGDKYAGVLSEVAYADVLKMLSKGFIRRVNRDGIRRTGFVFTVYETKPVNGVDVERRRWLLWPRQLNDELAKAGYVADMVDMPPMTTHLADDSNGTHALVFDLAMGFNQVPIPDDSQRNFGFVVRNPESGEKEYFVSTVMCMGVRTSPEILQKTVTAAVIEALAMCDPRPAVTYRVQVDGVRFVGSEQDLWRVQAAWLDVCKKFRITVKPEPELNVPHRVGEWMGVVHQLSSPTNPDTKLVWLPDRAVRKVLAAKALLTDDPTVSDVLSAYGCMAHYAQCLRAPMWKYFHGIKFVRRLASRLARDETTLDAKASIWACARFALVELAEFLIANKPARPLAFCSPANCAVHLFTDASKSGWGAVLIREGLVLHIGGRWPPGTDDAIADLEAKAVANAAAHFADELAGQRVRLVVDNTNVQHTLARGSAHAERLNEAIGAALGALGRANPASVVVAYIATKANPADEPSRGRRLVWSKLGADLGSWMADDTTALEIPITRDETNVGVTGVGVQWGA
jgi:hypothetical protein